MVKIIEKCNRGALHEGRNNGMAFAFLQKVDDETFHTVQPASPCKDYLAEVVFTENYDIPTKGCGLSYKKKLNIFSDVAYLAMKLLKTHSNDYYNYSPSFETDVKLLSENYKNIEKLINQFEERLELKTLTTIEPANDGNFLVKLPSDWCISTHSISLYTLLLRVLMVATEGETDILNFLKDYTYNVWDRNLLGLISDKIKLIWGEKKLPPNNIPYSKQNMLKFMGSPHDNGIVSWKGSFEEVPLRD
jgi:hypothetical protein